MKIKLIVACEIQYFELGIFSFNSYVYYINRGFIASTRAFNLLTRAFNLLTRTFSLPTHAFNLATRAFSVLTRGFKLVTRKFDVVTCRFELVTRGFESVTRVLLFHQINAICFSLPTSFLHLNNCKLNIYNKQENFYSCVIHCKKENSRYILNSALTSFTILSDPSALQANEFNFVCKGCYLNHKREIT